MAFREMVGAVGGFADSDLGFVAKEADLLGELVRIGAGLAIRGALVYEVLYCDSASPTSLAQQHWASGSADESLQFAQRVRAAQVMFLVDVRVV